jgi:serine/threonine protein kinase
VSAEHLLLYAFAEISQALEVANGLAYMHSLKLVHGDIKPVSLQTPGGIAIVRDGLN